MNELYSHGHGQVTRDNIADNGAIGWILPSEMVVLELSYFRYSLFPALAEVLLACRLPIWNIISYCAGAGEKGLIQTRV